MKRLFDLLLAVVAALVLGLPLVLVALLVKLTSKGPVLYWSERVGRGNPERCWAVCLIVLSGLPRRFAPRSDGGGGEG